MLPPQRPSLKRYVTTGELLGSCLLGTLLSAVMAWWLGWGWLAVVGPALGSVALGIGRSRRWQAALQRYRRDWYAYLRQEVGDGSAQK